MRNKSVFPSLITLLFVLVTAYGGTVLAADIVLIPGGEFEMGDHHGFVDPCHPSDELPLHTVNISPFYMSTMLVTCREYCDYLNAALANGLIEVRSGSVYAVGGTNVYFDTTTAVPLSTITYANSTFTVRSERELHPITGVRWFGAIAYCNWLSARDGYNSCYDLSTGDCDFTQNGYRLPTEAEWEYAARGGQYNPYYQFPWGDDTNIDGMLANWENSGDPWENGDYPHTTPVGFYNGALHYKTDYNWPAAATAYQTRDGSNAYGLYDMAGNAWEWVNDWYQNTYYSYCVANNIVNDPPGPVTGDIMQGGQPWRGLRGGTWWNGGGQQFYGYSRVSNRDPSWSLGGSPDGNPDSAWLQVGFRIIRRSLTSNSSPIISHTTHTPLSPGASDTVYITAQVTDDVNVAAVKLTYSSSASQVNTVFLETMRSTAVKPWTGDDCNNAWTVTGSQYIEQRTGSNYGTGNPCGMQFKKGTANLTDAMITTTGSINTEGTSGYVEFYIQTLTLDGTDGWTFQLDSGSGYVTRLSELSGTNHSWQLYHYDLLSTELISGLKMQFQFCGGNGDERIDLDQIVVKVTSGSVPVVVTMYDDGAHQDGLAGDGIYGCQIPEFPAGTTINCYITAIDNAGAQTIDPVTAPATPYSYTVSATSSNQTVGLFLNTTNAYSGYTLMPPMHSTHTYLINNAGQVVHKWTSTGEPGRSSYLLENGHMIRASAVTRGGPSTGGGEGGRIEEYDWDGSLVWAYDYYSANYIAHHDFKVLPNGNVLILAAEKKLYADVIAAGFNPSKLDSSISTQGYMLPDYVIEVQPSKPYGGTIVWEWHIWDHMIQDFSSAKNNYGVVANHPELINVNGTGDNIQQFWNHVNGIDYNPQLDQVMLSVRNNSELFVVDHGTTTAQAAGHTGGHYDKGGDILYRWGNPQQYGRGTVDNRMLYQQHHTHWIETGLSGAGNILIFNNGIGRGYSSVDEIVPPVDSDGNYTISTGTAFGPSSLTWTYVSSTPADFYSAEISGCQRLPNGNTLICEGVKGNLFEVTSAGQTVWRYVCPVTTTVLTQGDTIPADPGHADQFMNAVFRVNRYAPDYPGLADKDLTPGHPIEFCYAQFYNGNINGDCDIDMSDLALLAEQWLQTNCGQCNGADLTGDWKVDFADFAALAANWLEGFDESCYALTYSGDIDGDCNIDLHDFAMLAQQWLQTNCGQCSGADLTGDWKVGFADFVVFAANWLEGF